MAQLPLVLVSHGRLLFATCWEWRSSSTFTTGVDVSYGFPEEFVLEVLGILSFFFEKEWWVHFSTDISWLMFLRTRTYPKCYLHTPGEWIYMIHLTTLPSWNTQFVCFSVAFTICRRNPWAPGGKSTTSRWWQLIFFFHVHPYLGKISNLTHIFQMGWNHQPDMFFDPLYRLEKKKQVVPPYRKPTGCHLDSTTLDERVKPRAVSEAVVARQVYKGYHTTSKDRTSPRWGFAELKMIRMIGWKNPTVTWRCIIEVSLIKGLWFFHSHCLVFPGL